MPRPKLERPPLRICIRLPQDLLDELDPFLRSPISEKRKYGAISALVCALLKDHLRKVKASLPQEKELVNG